MRAKELIGLSLIAVRAGKGDLIQSVNGKVVTGLAEYKSAISAANFDKGVRLLIKGQCVILKERR